MQRISIICTAIRKLDKKKSELRLTQRQLKIKHYVNVFLFPCSLVNFLFGTFTSSKTTLQNSTKNKHIVDCKWKVARNDVKWVSKFGMMGQKKKLYVTTLNATLSLAFCKVEDWERYLFVFELCPACKMSNEDDTCRVGIKLNDVQNGCYLASLSKINVAT